MSYKGFICLYFFNFTLSFNILCINSFKGIGSFVLNCDFNEREFVIDIIIRNIRTKDVLIFLYFILSYFKRFIYFFLDGSFFFIFFFLFYFFLRHFLFILVVFLLYFFIEFIYLGSCVKNLNFFLV